MPKCPDCLEDNPNESYVCASCGRETAAHGILREAAVYWKDQGVSKKVRVACNSILLCGVVTAIAVHHVLPLAAGLAIAGVIYIKNY